MQVKFETTSARVKGLSFHPNRPWILASLHTGEIQLWDYRIGTLIDKFIDHEGPVRSVNFHMSQPLFVSGGDDAKIMGWNYKRKEKAFTLKGHFDYIRTVNFHNELPWVLSASDDYTVKIWNYVSRASLYTMTGHNNLVMCAQFHPTNDLIISCSLDQTLRLWDFSNLKKKHTSIEGRERAIENSQIRHEVEVKAIIDAHERGINWCAFHPTGNLIASVGDDRKVKLWKFSQGTGKINEFDTFYGHNNNVSCVLFHDKLDVIVTNSEDRTIRIWDLYKRAGISTFNRDTGRNWILASHPQINYLATGSDSGFAVFTLQSERIPAILAPNQQDLFYVHKKQLMHKDVKSGRETLIKEIDHTPTATSLIYHHPTSLYYNQFNNTSHNIVVQFKDKERIYHKYYYFSFDLNVSRAKHECQSTFRYSIASVFIGKDKIAILSNAKDVQLLESGGGTRALANLPLIDMIYPAGIGKLILLSECTAILYDTTTRKIINKIDYTDLQRLKRVAWNSKFSHVALLCKKTMYILNKSFNVLAIINETFKITSAVWNNDGVLIYTTKQHLKYTLTNGDSGIIKCLESPLYLVHVKDNEVIAVNGEGKFQKFAIDREEYLFKLALRNKDTMKIDELVKNYKRFGNSIISYLYQKKYSAVALHLVDDIQARFSLALDSGNLEVGFEACHGKLKDKASYTKLGEEALRQGNHQIVEIAYQQIRAFDKLSFLYVVTGNIPKLEKMLGIAKKREDVMSRFNNAIYLGDIKERIKIMVEAGLLHLAYLTAKIHNIHDMLEPLTNALENDIPTLEICEKAEALIPPKPLISQPQATPMSFCNWPHKELNEEDILLARANELTEDTQDTDSPELELNIDTNISGLSPDTKGNSGLIKEYEEPIESNWGVDDIMDLPDFDIPTDVHTNGEIFSSLADSAPGKDPIIERARNSQLAGELVTCGDFEGAAALLKKQIGLGNVDPFLPSFNKIFRSSQVTVSGLPFINSVTIQMSEDGKRSYVLGNISQLTSLLRVGYKLTTDGKFTEAISTFREILLHIPLLVLQNPQDEQDIYALINICYNYIMALKCEVTRRQVQDNPVRSLELSAYMCCCVMEPPHRILVLRNAMALAYKLQDFIYAAYFAKKVLQLAETHPNSIKGDKLENTRKVYAACEQKGTNQHTIDFDQNWLYDNDAVTRFCAKSLTTIKGNQVKKDAFVKASYKAEFAGELDEITGTCVIGAECLGLKLY